MSANPQSGLARPATPAAAQRYDSGFFSYHGLWAPGVRLFRKLSFATKASIITIAFVLPMLALLGFQLKSLYDQSVHTRMEGLRQHVEIVHGLVSWAQSEQAAGRLSKEKAQQMALDTIAKLRYEGNDYFWVNDTQARMLVNPGAPELNGKDVSGFKDPKGVALYSALIALVQQEGQGFINHQWSKAGSDKSQDRVSFVKGFAPWGWVIGSGINTGDLHDAFMKKLYWNCGIVAISLAMASYLFLSFYLVMDGGLKETRRHLRAIAEGDLTTSPSPWGKDEAAQLMLELRRMQDSLRGMVLRVRRSSDEIVNSSAKIATSATDLSTRTEQAASNLEESAASMEQISATTKSTSDHAAEAAKVASFNAQIAADGGRVMRDVVTTMENIRASSSKISDIISTIDGIAFQTNILALNAAVEAARAGEQGRGFAVVASEVRNLAQRSAEAAKEIKALIGSSVDQVEAGTGIVRKAGATIEEIVNASQRVNQLLGEIDVGAREQNLGIGQIGQAVQDLDRMTQRNAAMVDETAAAASEMKNQAFTLGEEVARFRLPAGVTLASLSQR